MLRPAFWKVPYYSTAVRGARDRHAPVKAYARVFVSQPTAHNFEQSTAQVMQILNVVSAKYYFSMFFDVHGLVPIKLVNVTCISAKPVEQSALLVATGVLPGTSVNTVAKPVVLILA